MIKDNTLVIYIDSVIYIKIYIKTVKYLYLFEHFRKYY